MRSFSTMREASLMDEMPSGAGTVGGERSTFKVGGRSDSSRMFLGARRIALSMMFSSQ